MAVPVGGNFSMFGHTNNLTIAGAIVEGGADSNTVSNTDNFNDLITLSDINKFDPLYSQGAAQLSEITQSIQYRGYPILECGEANTFSGGQSYPSEQSILLSSDTGQVTLSYQAFTVPDRFIVIWDGNVVIDTGYVGGTNYNTNGTTQRDNFKTSLNGKIDPITNTTYPDPINFPDDGFPRVTSPGSGTASFNKTLASPTICKTSVYGPMSGTEWNYTLGCPVPEPSPTPTPTPTPTPEEVCINWFNSVVKDDPGFQLESQLLMTRPTSIVVINNTTSSNASGTANTPTGVAHTINVSAIGESGIVTEGAFITLSITGGLNQPGNPFVVTSTNGFLTTSYEFIGEPSCYIIDAEVNYGVEI